MAEPSVPKKNKKKKKKSAVCNDSNQPSFAAPPVPSASISNGIKDDNNIINEILQQKVGMKTIFKEVEVTMTQCEADNTVASGKKKKKKKKSKQPAEIAQETLANEKDNSNLLNFCENRIELVNHPEISVTVSNVSEGQENGLKETEGKNINGTEKNECIDTATSSSSKKKKKKKKKKSSNSENTADVPPVSEEATYSAPTYVKLPASGDSCFLVVSHESFSNGNKLIIGNDADKARLSQNSISVVSNQKEATNEISQNNVPSFNSNMHIGSSVSIFPVPTSVGSETLSEKQTEIAKDPANLEIISNKVKNETKIDATVSKLVTNSNNENENPEEEPKCKPQLITKTQLKAARRAKQEAERAAKLAKNVEKIDSSVNKDSSFVKELSLLKNTKNSISKEKESVGDKSTSKTSDKEAFNKVRLFSHLPQYKTSYFYSKQLQDMSSKLHPSVLEVGSKYAKGIICGSNARCVALLGAFRDAIKDFTTPPNKNFSRELESAFQIYLNFLGSCRPLSVSMINAVKFLKHHINHIPPELDEMKAKENLCCYINDFVNVEILLAKEAISNSGSAKIVNGDIILVFAFSSLVKDVLCKAHNQNKVFRVVVVDSRPKMEGVKMLQSLVAQGIQCFYMPISAVSYIMKEVSKVIIGAHALLANGCVMSRLGCKQIALVASSYSVPVLVCCETYKFCERVLTDSFVHNELGDPEDLVHTSLAQNNSLENWHTLPSLKLLNLLYDVTPSDLISMVITEKGDLPCTSVPVVLRVRHAGLHE